MVTKMPPLTGFTPLKPSKPVITHACALTISRGKLHFNAGMFRHFKGNTAFTLAVRDHYLAVAKAAVDTPVTIHVTIRRRGKKQACYESYTNKGIYQAIVKELPERPNRRIRLVANPQDVHNDCVIFNLNDAK